MDLRQANLIKQLNEDLKRWERGRDGFNESGRARRLAKRQGVYLAEDDYGLLVQDMTPRKHFLRQI